MSARGEPRQRIVVALDPGASSDLPFDIARQLRSTARTEVVGLLVEDRRVLEHAGSRLAREVVLTGGERRLDVDAIERQLRAQTAAARRRFEARATDLGLRPELQILRGDVVAELLREAADAEALVVSLAAQPAAGPAWWPGALADLAAATLPAVLFARAGWVTGRGIVSVVASAAELAALEAAAAVAHRSASPLTVLLAAESSAMSDALAARAADLARASGVELQAVLPASQLTLELIVRVARGARLVVVARRETSTETPLVTTLLARLRAPLLVVGTSSGDTFGARRPRGHA